MQLKDKVVIVGFITDFGLKDSYIFDMHAVLPGICPGVRIIDITHNISPA